MTAVVRGGGRANAHTNDWRSADVRRTAAARREDAAAAHRALPRGLATFGGKGGEGDGVVVHVCVHSDE